MALSTEEIKIIEEALSVYLQIVSRQAPPEQVQQLAEVAQNIVKKLTTVGSGNGSQGNKPNGINDEWFENVCSQCDKLTPGGCSDKVTEKYPGKCDPILHYERQKIIAES